MEFVVLNNGVIMPMIGFGTWNLRGATCSRAVEEAVACGYRLIDTAQMYDNEEDVGAGIRRSGIEREKIFLTTKVCRPADSYEGTRRAIEQSLRKLDTEYIDLYLIHEPYRNASAMYKAMKEAHYSGKIRALGISNFNENAYLRFIEECGIVPAVNQVEAHVFFAQTKLQSVLKAHGTHMEAWSPFAAGKDHIFNNKTLGEIGCNYRKSTAQVALRYLMQQGMSAIPKTSHRKRMKENIDIFDFTLSEKDMEQIRKLDKNRSLFGWYP